MCPTSTSRYVIGLYNAKKKAGYERAIVRPDCKKVAILNHHHYFVSAGKKA